MLHRSSLFSLLFFTLMHFSMAGRYIYVGNRSCFSNWQTNLYAKDIDWSILRCLLEKPLPGITGKVRIQLFEDLGTRVAKTDYHPAVILSQEVGLIIVPGAHLPGESYMPLLREIQVKAIGLKQYLNYFFLSLTLKRIVDPITPLFQASYPGPLWIGSTAEWLGDMPTPIEVTQQVSKSQKRK